MTPRPWRRAVAIAVAVASVAALAACHGRPSQHALDVDARCGHYVSIDGTVIYGYAWSATVHVEVAVPTWTSPGDAMPVTATLFPEWMENGLPFSDLTLESSGWVDPGDEDNQLVFSDLVATEDPVLQTQRPTITASPNQRITVRAVSARS